MIPVDKWHVNRRTITPAFNSNILRKFFPIFNEKIQVLIKSLNKELGNTQQFDLWDYIITTNNYIICRKYFNFEILPFIYNLI